MKFSVVIPSKSRPHQSRFLMEAIKSVKRQGLEAEIIVAVDKLEVEEFAGVRFVLGTGGQAAAMNAGAAAATTDYLAFLEDDDLWGASRVSAAFDALKEADFTSTTQLEVNPDAQFIRINDFPTPSGWFMRRAVWDAVGPFNTDYRWHLDNEWLGRLSRSEAKRVHLVESTAPQTPQDALYRPFLKAICSQGLNSTLARHGGDFPLVQRLVHKGSGMARLSCDEIANKQSSEEYRKLMATFGSVPC